MENTLPTDHHNDRIDQELGVKYIDQETLKKEKRKEIIELMLWNKSKLISLVIALLYLIVGSVALGGIGFLEVFGFLLMPMALIWLPDIFGNHTGSSIGLGGSSFRRISAPTPALFVKLAGWFFLLFPIVQAIFFSATP